MNALRQQNTITHNNTQQHTTTQTHPRLRAHYTRPLREVKDPDLPFRVLVVITAVEIVFDDALFCVIFSLVIFEPITRAIEVLLVSNDHNAPCKRQAGLGLLF